MKRILLQLPNCHHTFEYELPNPVPPLLEIKCTNPSCDEVHRCAPDRLPLAPPIEPAPRV